MLYPDRNQKAKLLCITIYFDRGKVFCFAPLAADMSIQVRFFKWRLKTFCLTAWSKEKSENLGIQKYARLYEEYARTCENMRKYARICKNMIWRKNCWSADARTYNGFPGPRRVWKKARQSCCAQMKWSKKVRLLSVKWYVISVLWRLMCSVRIVYFGGQKKFRLTAISLRRGGAFGAAMPMWAH
jgi:hypothetical protein